MAEGRDNPMKHVAAFLGAPVGAAALGVLIWFGMKEDCSSVVRMECVRFAGNEYGIADVAMFAGGLAVVAAVFIEFVMD